MDKLDAKVAASLIGIGLIVLSSDLVLRDRGRSVIKLSRERTEQLSHLATVLYGTQSFDEISEMSEEQRAAALEDSAERGQAVGGTIIGWLAQQDEEPNEHGDEAGGGPEVVQGR